ncbi:Ankyrin repeat-containing domain protein [Elaphomyces granulatus]
MMSSTTFVQPDGPDPASSQVQDPWILHRETLRQLYIVEKKTLKEVKAIMETFHGFIQASDLLGLKKNLKSSDWQAIGRCLEKRKRDGKDDGEVIHPDTGPIPPAKVRREVLRNRPFRVSEAIAQPTKCEDIEVVRILLNLGVSPNTPLSKDEAFSKPPLHNAAYRLDCDMVELLLEAGADVNSLDYEKSSTALFTAIGCNYELEYNYNYSCLHVLIKAGATINDNIDGYICYDTCNADKLYRILSPSCEAAKSKLTVGGILNAATDGLQALSQYLAKRETAFQREMLERSLCNAIPYYPNALVSLLEYGVDPNGYISYLPLTCAINVNEIDDVSILLGYGAEINLPAVLAASSSPNKFPILNFLINQGADIQRFGTSAIQEAVHNDNICAAKLLLASGVDINSFTPKKGTVLAEAARYGGLKTVKFLLSKGAEVNPVNHSCVRDTPLYAALVQGNWVIAKLLLEYGANIKDDSPKHTLLEACLLVPQTYAWKKRSDEKIEMFEFLLSKGAKINGPLKRPLLPIWDSALTLLIMENAGHKTILLALEAGADVNQMGCGSDARTPIQAASEKGNLEVTKLLHSRGANINAPAGTIHGRTALQAACCLTPPNIELVQFLLEHGADVNAPAAIQQGLTALQGAAITGYIKVAMLLLDWGADPNGDPAFEDGRTALDGAAEHGRLDMVQFLLNVGAQSETPGETGYDNAIELANNGFHFAIAEMLKSHSHKSM